MLLSMKELNKYKYKFIWIWNMIKIFQSIHSFQSIIRKMKMRINKVIIAILFYIFENRVYSFVVVITTHKDIILLYNSNSEKTYLFNVLRFT